MSSHDSSTDSSSPTSGDSENQNESQPRRLSMLMPLLLDLAAQRVGRPREPESQPERDSDLRSRFRVIMFDGRSGSVIVMDGTGDVENLFGDLFSKSGVSPASKASIEAMPRVVVNEADAACAICLESYEVGGEAREMPCKHSFHSGCIEKWLVVRGSCPMCRFVMPAEKIDSNDGGGSEGGEELGDSIQAIVDLRVWVREGHPESGDPMTADEDSGSGDESEEAYPNGELQEDQLDEADDSTSMMID